MERTPVQYDTPPSGYLPCRYYHRTRRSRMYICGSTRFFPLEMATILQSKSQPNTEPSPAAAAAAAAAQVTGSTRTRIPYAMPESKWMHGRATTGRKTAPRMKPVQGTWCELQGYRRQDIMLRPLRRQQGLCTVTYLSTQPPAHPPTHSPTTRRRNLSAHPSPTHPPIHPYLHATWYIVHVRTIQFIPGTWYSSTVEITP